MFLKENEMTTNRYEAIERALTAILVAGDVTRDTLEIAQKALAMPKDAERVCESCAEKDGSWVRADDVSRLAKELDFAMNGNNGAVSPSLCDVVAQAVSLLNPKADSEKARLVFRIRTADLSADNCYLLMDVLAYLTKGGA